MSENDEKSHGHIQASDNSNAIGGDIVISGVIQDSSHIHVGHTIGYSAEQVSVLVTQISATFQVKPFDGRCPYKGLEVFSEEDSELFFGREKLIEDLVSRVKVSRTVFITGPSGSGKSSLVRAGLMHKLKQAGIKELHSEGWLYATIKPGREPINALARAVAGLAMSTNAEDEIRAKALTDETIFSRWCEIALQDGRDKRVVLFIDQFEEVFTQISKEEERVAFLNLLNHAAKVENGRLIVLFSMRSDFVPNCATYPKLNAMLNQQFVQIGAMQPDELVNAIAQPALRVGLRIGPDLIAQIINDMHREPGSLPLMQFALKDLFDSQQEKGGLIALTLNDYLQRGGIHKALERHADASFAKLEKDEQELARSIFSGLIEIGRGTQDTRRTANIDELIPAGAKAEEVREIIQKLADARLITTDEAAGNDTVSISHEKLIDAWPWLRKLVNENRDMIALQNEIVEDAKEWEKHSQDASYLYIGARLTNAREKLEIRKLVLSGLAQAFVEAGIEIETAKAQEEEKRHQKELDDAHMLAETAQARAQAERRGRITGIWIIVIAVVLITVLSYDPIRRKILQQQAMGPEMITISANSLIPSFLIDPYPVTNERYGFCIQAGICSRPDALQSEYADQTNANKLVVNVTAIDAAEFCHWLGRRLPSETEWKLAVQKNTFQPISPEALTDADSFYEWTSTPYDLNKSEWIDVSKDPPEVITQKGGQLSETFVEHLDYRQDQLSTQPDYTTGFRCVANQ